MSQWDDRIRNHQVWQQMEALGPAIDQAVVREGIDAEVVGGLERIRAVLAFTGKRLAGADPAITHPAPLDAIAIAFQNALAEVQAFIANGNPGHVTNANSHADSALANTNQVSVPFTPDELAQLKDATVSYRKTLEGQLQKAKTASDTLRSETDALRNKLSELTNEIAAERQRLSQLASDHQAQFSAAQEARSREFSEAQTARQNNFATIIADYTQRLTDQNADFTRQKETAVRQYQDDISALKEKYARSAQDILNQVDDQRRQVEKLVGVIGNLGVTSGYLKTANNARKTMIVWQAITVISMAGLIIVAYKAFLPLVQGTFTWEGLAGRIFLSLTVGVLAAYAANQADKFLAIERHNRKLALELEAIGPYLAPLPQESQDKFRLALGELSFGREESGTSKRADKSPATVIDILMQSKEFREFVAELVRAARQG
jgi:hypothetical protein